MPENLVYLNLGGPSGKPLPVSAVADLISNLGCINQLNFFDSTAKFELYLKSCVQIISESNQNQWIFCPAKSADERIQPQKSLLSVGGYPFTGKAVIEARRKHGEHWTTKMRYLHDRCGQTCIASPLSVFQLVSTR